MFKYNWCLKKKKEADRESLMATHRVTDPPQNFSLMVSVGQEFRIWLPMWPVSIGSRAGSSIVFRLASLLGAWPETAGLLGHVRLSV